MSRLGNTLCSFVSRESSYDLDKLLVHLAVLVNCTGYLNTSNGRMVRINHGKECVKVFVSKSKLQNWREWLVL